MTSVDLTSQELRTKIDKESHTLGTTFVCTECKRFFLESILKHGHDDHKCHSIREIKYNWSGSGSTLPK